VCVEGIVSGGRAPRERRGGRGGSGTVVAGLVRPRSQRLAFCKLYSWKLRTVGSGQALAGNGRSWSRWSRKGNQVLRGGLVAGRMEVWKSRVTVVNAKMMEIIPTGYTVGGGKQETKRNRWKKDGAALAVENGRTAGVAAAAGPGAFERRNGLLKGRRQAGNESRSTDGGAMEGPEQSVTVGLRPPSCSANPYPRREGRQAEMCLANSR
jgi:hypothetical protein